jgi:hypothetical protein
MARRSLPLAWIELALTRPDRIEDDPLRPEAKRYYVALAANADRVLRVVAVPLPNGFRVITAMLDRGERRRRAR